MDASVLAFQLRVSERALELSPLIIPCYGASLQSETGLGEQGWAVGRARGCEDAPLPIECPG